MLCMHVYEHEHVAIPTSIYSFSILIFRQKKGTVSKFIALHKDFNKSKHFPMFIELILYVIPIENTAKIRDESKTRLSSFSDMSKSFLLYRFVMGVVTISIYLFIYQFRAERIAADGYLYRFVRFVDAWNEMAGLRQFNFSMSRFPFIFINFQ